MNLYGKNPVLERLRSNPKSIRKIFLQENHVDGSYICTKANKWNIPVITVPRSKIIKLGKSLNTQGVLADVEDFSYSDYRDLLSVASEKNQSLLFLDEINDPQNLGAIMRSAACLGDFGIVLPVHHSAEVTEAVLRVASGADNYIPVAKVSNLNQAISLAKEAGFWVAGTVVEGGKNLLETTLPFPLSIVVGSEQKGIREIIRKQLDLTLTLPMKYAKMSLNAAQAATIFCYEITKQKNKKSSKGSGQK